MIKLLNIIIKQFSAHTCTKKADLSYLHQKKRTSHTCIQCKRTSNEASFSNKADELCRVCEHYGYSNEIFCCNHPVILHHGEPEMCPFCGNVFILEGIHAEKIDPYELYKHHVYISQVLYHQDGADRYLEGKEEIAKHIKDGNMAYRYRSFYELLVRITKSERKRIAENHSLQW